MPGAELESETWEPTECTAGHPLLVQRADEGRVIAVSRRGTVYSFPDGAFCPTCGSELVSRE
jgi:hypothetical protein